MPSTRIAYPEIMSWTPAIEAKASETGSLFVLEGKNYFFDSKGPVSGFGGVVLAAGKVQEEKTVVESISLAHRTLILTETQALERQTDDSQGDFWHELAELASIYAPNPRANRWTQAYVGYTSYVCHPQHGIYRVDSDSLSPYEVDGAPEEPIGITESNGRLIILSKFTVSWSAPFDGENLNPELGGGGFQITAELIPGNPIAVTPFEAGFLVWTDGGVLIGEYTGSDEVFRYDAINTQQLMLSGISWCPMDDASVIVVTRSGLNRSTATAGFQEVDVIFNEYLRDVINESDDLIIRPVYIQEVDHLYVQLMDGAGYYNRTFVYSMKLQKWGEFSTPHLGICRFSNEFDDYGYIDLRGYPIQFKGSQFIEDFDGTRTGLDSEIVLGYIRPAAEARSADVEFEIQEVLTSACRKATIDSFVEEDWGGVHSFTSYNLGWYSNREDWNGFSVLDYAEDWGATDSLDGTNDDEDWQLAGDNIDYNDNVVGPHSFDWNQWDVREDWGDTPEGSIDGLPLEDWRLMGPPDEDWQGPQAFLNTCAYQIRLMADLDGYESTLEVEPALAVAKPDSDFYTCFTHGHNHRVKFMASQPGEKFHVRSLAITLHYSGQLS